VTVVLKPSQVFRVVTDFEALLEALRDRVEDLGLSYSDVERLGVLRPGYVQSLLAVAPPKNLGIKGFSGLLKATGVILVLTIDPQRTAEIKALARQRQMRGAAVLQKRKRLMTAGRGRDPCSQDAVEQRPRC
jgi:hypothetical protein